MKDNKIKKVENRVWIKNCQFTKNGNYGIFIKNKKFWKNLIFEPKNSYVGYGKNGGKDFTINNSSKSGC